MDIISLLPKINQYYYSIICQLLLLICRYVPLRQWAHDELHSPKYQKFKTDKLPIIKNFEKYDYLFLLEYYLWKYGKPLLPIKRKSGSENLVSDKTVCPRCGATHYYLYCNNGKKVNFGVRYAILNFKRAIIT